MTVGRKTLFIVALVSALVFAPPAPAAEKGGWMAQRPLGSVPAWSQSASAIYDPVRDRVVMFGGYDDGAALDATWLLQLNGRPRWVESSRHGTPPGCWDHTAVYDSGRERMVVFGGVTTPDGGPGVDQSAVWALGLAHGAAWESLAVSGAAPAPRDGHSAIYDPVHERMVVFGGGGAEGLLGDAWTLALAGTPQWSPIPALGGSPVARARHSAIHDPVGARMLVFGGATFEGGLLGDLWSLSLDENPTWKRLDPEGAAPAARAGHRAIYDPVGRRMLMFGGYVDAAEPWSAELWELSLGDTLAWTLVRLDGPAPEGRLSPVLVRDDFERELVLAGGAASGPKNDLWTLSLDGRNGRGRGGFAISPNPMRAGNAHMAFLLPVAGEVEMEVVDVAGRRAWAKSLGGMSAGWQQLSLDAPLKAGVYWVRVRDDGWQRVERLVVLR